MVVGGLEYTVAWDDPEGFDPTLRLAAEFVRRTKNENSRRHGLDAGQKRERADVRKALSLPSNTRSGRAVRQVVQCTVSTEHMYLYTHIHTHTCTHTHTHTHTKRERERERDRQTQIETDRQAERNRERERERE